MSATPPALRYVPQVPDDDATVAAQAETLATVLRGRRFTVLTGAGCSTESGIPDYRGPETRRRARNPVRFAEFIGDVAARRRYWARALVGYRRFSGRAPNAAHHALATLERGGLLTGLITQNIDDLHGRAGSVHLVELHGNLSRVRCLQCGAVSPREALQARLLALNPALGAVTAEMAPDGDAELPPELVERFVVADCEACGGPLKPSVVFFGENVPPPRVHRALSICDAADALLVVGSSLAVYSGLRFVRRMVERGRPVALLNVGESRADADCAVRVEGLAARVLPALGDALLRTA